MRCVFCIFAAAESCRLQNQTFPISAETQKSAADKNAEKASHLNEPLPGQLGDPIFSVVNRGLRSNVNVVVLVLVVVVNVVVVFVGIFESWPRPDSNSIKLILPVTGEKCNTNVNQSSANILAVPTSNISLSHRQVQCDQMARFFVRYFIYNYEKLTLSIKHLPKQVQNSSKY